MSLTYRNGVRTTEELGKVISDLSAVQHDAVLDMVAQQTNKFREALKTGSLEEFVKAFYEMFDEVLADKVTGVSCKKGCYLCCRQNVTIWDAEASVIVAYCKEHDIKIPRAYLEEQLKHGWREVAKTDIGWCTFLKDGVCSIYPVRPLACRKYFVASPPQLCDTVKFPADQGHRVAVAIFTIPEIEASAFYGVMADFCKYGRLPEMLLSYSQ